MATEYLNNKIFERLIVKFHEASREKAKYDLIVDEIQSTETRLYNKRNRFHMPESWITVKNRHVLLKIDYENAQEELVLAFRLLSENIVGYTKFKLIDHDDAIQDGIVICLEKIDRFDPARGKAFNYFTTCIINSLKQSYRGHKNYNQLKRKFKNFMIEISDSLPNQGRVNKNFNKIS